MKRITESKTFRALYDPMGPRGVPYVIQEKRPSDAWSDCCWTATMAEAARIVRLLEGKQETVDTLAPDADPGRIYAATSTQR